MARKTAFGWLFFGILFAVLAMPAHAQAPAQPPAEPAAPAAQPPAQRPAPPPRGKAEMKAGAGVITIDYGRPSLRGRDMLAQLQDGAFWRMGMNQATVLSTPVELSFGSVKVAKGDYSLWLKKTGDAFQLVFNSQTGQWGTQHDPAKDVCSVAMTKVALAGPVETLTIDLVPAAQGGSLDLSWGAMKLASPFEMGK
jgi:Protein of unknown function (DUF2911)